MTALISKLKLQHSLSTSAWPNYGLDVLMFRCYHAYKSGNTFNECLCVVLEQNLWLT